MCRCQLPMLQKRLEGQVCALSQGDTGRCAFSKGGRKPRMGMTWGVGGGMRHEEETLGVFPENVRC